MKVSCIYCGSVMNLSRHTTMVLSPEEIAAKYCPNAPHIINPEPSGEPPPPPPPSGEPPPPYPSGSGYY